MPHARLLPFDAALHTAGGSLRGITKLATSLVDRAHREPVYEAVGHRLRHRRRLPGRCNAVRQHAHREGPRQSGTADGSRYHRNCHCEERSDAAISGLVRTDHEIASLRSQ
jgi:hypothetical protein